MGMGMGMYMGTDMDVQRFVSRYRCRGTLLHLLLAWTLVTTVVVRKTLLLQVAPSHIKTNVLDIAKTGRVYNNPKYAGMKTMIVVESPADALALIDAGVSVKEINVGGVTYKDGMKQVSEAVYTSDADIESKTLQQQRNKRGKRVYA